MEGEGTRTADTAERFGRGIDEPIVGHREDSADFESFMLSQGRRFVQALTVISLDREVAADAAQEAFIQLYLRWDGDRPRDPAAWLYRVGINRCRDHHRFLSRTARVVERLGSQPAPEERELTRWAPGEDFAGALRALPKGQRTAATLYYLNDLSVLEIAEIMGISEGTVNSHLHRAREALKRLVEAG